MAGKKMRSRKNNSHNLGYARYKSLDRRGENRFKRTARHVKKVAKQAELSEQKNTIVNELITECNNNFKLGTGESRAKYILKRILGTLTPNKLNCLLSREIAEEEWFQERPATPELKKILSSTRIPSDIVDAMRDVPSYKK